MLKTNYLCHHCGAMAPRWLGRCPECGAWGSLQEVKIDSSVNNNIRIANQALAFSLQDIVGGEGRRFKTGLSEFDRVTGNGLVEDSVILLGGDPGIGKSTLALQISTLLSEQIPSLYVSGEESLAQLKLRAERILTSKQQKKSMLKYTAEANFSSILSLIREQKIRFVVIDSIQTMFSEDISSYPGSVTQLREVTAKLIELAKSEQVTILIIGHVTKDGSIAGPKVLEHMVDAVLYFEGEPNKNLRLVRSFKNRFGATGEVGIFEMMDSGLKEISDPATLFLHLSDKMPEGTAIFPSIKGTRPILVEIQALVTANSGFGAPRRTVSGLEYNRVAIILAVLEKKAGYKLAGYDIYLNVTGGLVINEPAADLAIAYAIISSYKSKSLPPYSAVMGEIGLSGEIRSASQSLIRMKEVNRLGFQKLFLAQDSPSFEKSSLQLNLISKLWEDLF